jgi:glutathione S-transferase
MKLYYKPGACSLASHIALHETGAVFEIEAVDTDAGRTETGDDFRAISPNGYVPALRLDNGAILTEGAAVLQWIADSHHYAGLAPDAGTIGRARLHEALNWISAELHKAFGPLFRSNATEDEKAAAHIAVATKFDRVEAQFSDGRTWMVADRFSVADAYLFAVANWANYTGIDLARWPSLAAFVARVAERPATQHAMKAEGLIQ